MSDEEQHRYATNKFIELANQLKDEEIEPAMVSGALMTASGIYATYVAAGNNGALEPSGVDKIVDVYRRTLEHHQLVKKSHLQKRAAEAGAEAPHDATNDASNDATNDD